MDASKTKVFVSAVMNYGQLGHLNLGNENLLKLYEECLILAQCFDDISTASQLNLLIGLLNEQMKNTKEALIYYKEFLKVAEELGDESLHLEACTRLGTANQKLGKYDEAVEYFEQCLDIVKATGDKEELGICYKTLGTLYEKIRKFSNAIAYFEEFLKISPQLAIDSRKEELSANAKLGRLYFYLGEYQKSEEYSQNALEIAKNLGVRREEGDAYGNLGNAYQKLGRYQEAVQCFEKYLEVAKEVGKKEVEKVIYWNLGCAFKKLSQYENAIENLEKFLEISVSMGDKKGEMMAYGNLANPYEKLGKYDKLIEVSEKKLQIAQEIQNQEGQSIACLHLGVAYQTFGQLQKAIDFLERSLDLARESGNKKFQSHAHTNLGIANRMLRQESEATTHYEESMRLSRELEDKEGEMYAYLNLGVLYAESKKCQEAMSCYEKSLEISKETGNKHGEGTAYVNMGSVSSALGKYHEADVYFEKALAVFKHVGYKKREGEVCRILGNFYSSLGMYNKALENHKKSYGIALEIGDKMSQEAALANLGSAFQNLKNFTEAMKKYEEGLEIARDIGDKTGEGRTAANIGSLYQLQREYHKAFEFYEKSLKIAEEIGDMKSQAHAFGNLGGLCVLEENYDEAIKYCEKSLSIVKDTSERRIEGKAYNNLGSAFHHLSNDVNKDETARQQAKKKAIFCLQEALKCWEWLYGHLEDKDDFKISIFETYIITYKTLASVLIENQQIEEALLVCDRGRARALADLLYSKYGINNNEAPSTSTPLLAKEDIENVVSTNVSILSFSFTKGIVAWVLTEQKPMLHFTKCDNKLLITHTQGDVLPESAKIEDIKIQKILSEAIKKAYEKMGVDEEENCKDESLGNTVDNSSNANNLSISPPEQESLPEFGEEILDHTDVAEVASASQSETSDSDKVTSSKILSNVKPSLPESSEEEIPTHMDVANPASETAGALHTGHSNLSECSGDVKPSLSESSYKGTLTELNVNNASSEVALQGGDVTISSGSCHVKQSLPEEATTRDDHYGASNGSNHVLELLYAVLIAPVIQHLQQEIVIIPDGPLYMVPFAALRDPVSDIYLSETKTIRIVPSLSSLRTWKKSRDQHHMTGALIVGNPDVGQVMFKGETKTFDPLPSAEREAESVAKFLNAKPLTGSQATKEMIKQKLREGVAVIHIAAHGDEEHGHIALAPPPRTDATSIPEEQDYMLTMQEVQEIGVTAQLVVLSCCHSGRGDIKAEGVVGMSRAFLAAGARAVVASLWAVDDYATSRFMASFYASLKMGESASKSLQIAMEDIRDEEGCEDPMFWAPFFLIGDDVTISG